MSRNKVKSLAELMADLQGDKNELEKIQDDIIELPAGDELKEGLIDCLDWMSAADPWMDVGGES